MSVVKSFAVGIGDMCYIEHGSDNFTIIDCNLTTENADEILEEIKEASSIKGVSRFISTHPDQDHFGGIERLDDELPIRNFYVVKNSATKDVVTQSFERYCELRDGDKAFYIEKGCTRRWMNKSSEDRGSSGINILWPNRKNQHFKNALADAEAGTAFNNMSAVIRYKLTDGASVMWIGDLETQFMEDIADDINLTKTTVVFASHHGRKSGKIPDTWLEKLDPQVIIIGEAPSRHLNYYTGYKTITQNSAGDITMDCVGDRVHFYVSNESFQPEWLVDEGQVRFPNYIGSITVETEYTL